MKVVIDTNRIIAAIIKDSISRELIFNNKFDFYSVEAVILEIGKYKEEIMSKAKLKDKDFDNLLSNFV